MKRMWICRLAVVLPLGGALLGVSAGVSTAQSWPPWADDLFGRDFDREPRWRDEPRWRERKPQARPRDDWSDMRDGDVRDGGARPTITPVAPTVVAFPHDDFPANSIVINVGERKLYYVLPDKQAYEYRIGVGRDGFGWTGTENVSRKQAWPDWHPPAEMRDRDPSLPEKMTGGLKNPLGATALYLGDTLYRIHGTNDAKSIGRAESSGCFRMLNASAVHLASLTEIGTPVTVVTSLPQHQIGRAPQTVPQPSPAADKAERAPTPLPRPAPDATRPPERAPPKDATDHRSLRDYTLQAR